MSRWHKQTPEQKQLKLDYQKRYRAENREAVLDRGRRCERRRKLKKYGLTEESYNQMWQDQNESCAICLTSEKGTRDWHVDHCHRTGVVRGILCHHCNLMLGNARDSEDILEAGMHYLQKEWRLKYAG